MKDNFEILKQTADLCFELAQVENLPYGFIELFISEVLKASRVKMEGIDAASIDELGSKIMKIYELVAMHNRLYKTKEK
jgi:hypothetical protein